MMRFKPKTCASFRGLILAGCVGLTALMIGCPGVTPTPPPTDVVANAGPDRTVEVGQAVALEGSASGGTPPYTFRWQQISGPVQAIAADTNQTATVLGQTAGTAVFRLTVTDANGFTDSDDVTVQVTAPVVPPPPVVVVAAEVPPRRSDPAGLTIQLAGAAAQTGAAKGALFVTWSLLSQPEGSGPVTIHDPHAKTTTVDLGPPALPGDYVFQFTAVNIITGDEATPAVVTVRLIDEPLVRVQEGTPIRRNVLQAENNSIEVDLVYSFGAPGSFDIFDGRGTAQANLLATVDVPAAAADEEVTVTIPIDGARLMNPPDVYLLQYIATDGVTTTALEDLVDTAAAATPSLQQLALYVSRDFRDEDLEGAEVMPVVELAADVGEVDGGNVIIYQGVGAGDPTLANLAQQTHVADINGDGIDDLLTLTAAGVEVRLGSEDILTNGDVAGTGDAWKAADFTISGAAAGAYTGIAVGDFNNDGSFDVVLVAAAETTIEVFLLEEPAEDVIAASFIYSTTAAAADIAPTVAVGDFNGDGIDDFAVGLPGAAHDLVGAPDQGVVIVMYGVTGADTLPASGAIQVFDPGLIGVVDATADRYGEVILGENQFGQVLGAGQFIAGDGDELAVAEGAGMELVIYQGGVGERLLVEPPAPAFTYTTVAAGDLLGGAIRFGDVTGDAAVDMVVTSPAQNTVYFVPAGTPDATALDTLVQLTALTVNGVAVEIAEGDDLELADVDGDGQLDVLIGATSRILVLAGPAGAANVVEDDILLVLSNADAGRNIAQGDVNADGIADWLFGSEAELYMIAGLE